MRNIEFKARLDDPKAALAKARALDADLWGDLRQTDTYFDAAYGRLKLRETAGFPGELVRYERTKKAPIASASTRRRRSRTSKASRKR